MKKSIYHFSMGLSPQFQIPEDVRKEPISTADDVRKEVRNFYHYIMGYGKHNGLPNHLVTCSFFRKG